MKLFALLNHFVERRNTGWECYYYHLLLERNFDQLHTFHFFVDLSHLSKKFGPQDDGFDGLGVASYVTCFTHLAIIVRQLLFLICYGVFYFLPAKLVFASN